MRVIEIESESYLVTFNELRPLLFSIAWRMVGNSTDAEDLLQEALIRWERNAHDGIRSPRAFLVTMVTRLCLNHLDLARVRNEVLFSTDSPTEIPWAARSDSVGRSDLTDALDAAFSIVLQCLAPIERAVFLLREVFDQEYAEIGAIVDKSEDNCRQILRRARFRIAEQERRFHVAAPEHELALQEFLAATRSGDVNRLAETLTKDVSLTRDGANLGVAGPPPIRGRQSVARALIESYRETSEDSLEIRQTLWGVPCLLVYQDGLPRSASVMHFCNDRVRNVYQIRCPVRLRFLALPLPPLPVPTG